jgi:hypothetical protein
MIRKNPVQSVLQGAQRGIDDRPAIEPLVGKVGFGSSPSAVQWPDKMKIRRQGVPGKLKAWWLLRYLRMAGKYVVRKLSLGRQSPSYSLGVDFPVQRPQHPADQGVGECIPEHGQRMRLGTPVEVHRRHPGFRMEDDGHGGMYVWQLQIVADRASAHIELVDDQCVHLPASDRFRQLGELHGDGLFEGLHRIEHAGLALQFSQFSEDAVGIPEGKCLFPHDDTFQTVILKERRTVGNGENGNPMAALLQVQR